jgi:hypothetical protein
MYEHPIDAIGNTLSPIIEAFEEAIHNEDFYHVEIRRNASQRAVVPMNGISVTSSAKRGRVAASPKFGLFKKSGFKNQKLKFSLADPGAPATPGGAPPVPALGMSEQM